MTNVASNPLIDTDILIIGAGVVGLAIARQLARRASVIVIEQEATFGTGISSRNSEVIHAGLYYPHASLKALLCIEGKHLLYEYCSDHAVSYRRIGKFVVAASPSEVTALEDLKQRAESNGVDDLSIWTQSRLSREEPQLRAAAALFSPGTGIVDSHGLMRSLMHEAQSYGAEIAFNCQLLTLDAQSNAFTADVISVGEPCQIRATTLINCAGLQAQAIAELCATAPQHIPQRYLCKGSYFSFSGKSPFSHLIYPLPQQHTTGLGIHATLDLSGQLRFGPDVEYLDKDDLHSSDFVVDSDRAGSFYRAIRRYFPTLPDDSLYPAYAGIRPKLHGPRDPAADFLISSEANHRQAGLIHLFGIESPGLTASLAIAKHVEQLI